MPDGENREAVQGGHFTDGRGDIERVVAGELQAERKEEVMDERANEFRGFCPFQQAALIQAEEQKGGKKDGEIRCHHVWVACIGDQCMAWEKAVLSGLKGQCKRLKGE